MRRLVLVLGAVALVLGSAGLARAEQRGDVISTGKKFKLSKALQPEGTTVLLFIQGMSAMEQEFRQELEQALPDSNRLVLQVVELKRMKSPAAKQFGVEVTPTAIVYDRFGREIARSSKPDGIRAAVRVGMLMGRIHWISEDDPKAPEIYGAPPQALRRGLPGIVKTFSLRKDAFQLFMGMSRIHFSDGFLKRREHELIAAYVSALNECKF